MNNEELIAAGHELAKCLDNEPLLDIAKMLSKMATQLDVTTAALREKTKQCEQLAAESVALKDFGDKLDRMHNDLNGEGTGIQGRAEVACQQIALEAAMEEFDAIETPATDAFLREVRASAVDAVCLKISNSIVSCRQDEMIGLDEAVNIASDFAVEMRQGGAA
ncbi:hypothetical protein FZI02_08955 [Cronobacter sakazakii]|nr:hypothetical protein [Cronobacter sakazakii]EJG0747472.1 hypothetical protein [Cronobacter sakazakii]KAB0839047.1 hypothetical protein FZI45_18955 [Cronobacter sakazakii]KAB0840128.1 hypothetical protein FZI02_08955 [Cronobacter sakazakii]